MRNQFLDLLSDIGLVNNAKGAKSGVGRSAPKYSAPKYSSGLGRSSEGPEAIEAPVSFNFLGAQQIMRNQHPGLEQSHSRQQQGINEMNLWQQHLMFKRLQETQSQQQLQQLRQRGMHHNSPSQFSGIARQGTNDQVPTAKEEKKEGLEEESDEDIGFSLFDD